MVGVLSKPIKNKDCHEFYHHWDEDCFKATLSLFVISYKYCLKLYTPFYIVTSLLTRKKKEYFTKKLLREILQSSAFLSSNAFLLPVFVCLLRKLFGGLYIAGVGILPGIFASFCAIIVERKSRRPALALYMFNQAVDISYNMIKSAGLDEYAQHILEVTVFSMCMAVLFYMHRTNTLPVGYIKSTFDYFFELPSSTSGSIHIYNQLKKLLEMTCRAFGIGYGIQTAYHLFIASLNIFKNPKRIPLAFVKKLNLQTAAFCGSIVGTIQFIELLLNKFTNSTKRYLIAGAFSGCATMFMRSSYVIVYILCKTVELLYRKGLEKGYLPYVKYYDIIMYALCTGFMIHNAVIQPSNLRTAYWKFLLNLTGGLLKDIRRKCLNVYGYDSDWIHDKECLKNDKTNS